MSIESVRNRLAEATTRPWKTDDTGCCVYDSSGDVHIAQVSVGGPRGRDEDAVLIAHAPTDLELALTELEQARKVIDIANDWNAFDEWDSDTEGIEALVAFRAARNAFEAAP